MRAAVLRAVGRPMEIEDAHVDDPMPHEVLIRVKASGLCHSDLHAIEGHDYTRRLPVVLGHEASGIVERVGSDVTSLAPGDHVIACMSIYCGHCKHCLRGRPALCLTPEAARGAGETPRLVSRGDSLAQYVNLGAFAEYMLIHERACVAIRKDMPFDAAALMGCSIVTGLGAVMHTSKVEVGETVAVIGCGGVGLATINGAAIAGASRIIAIDIAPSKLEMAKHFGATDFIDASSVDPVKAVRSLTDGGVDHSFEVIGLKATIEQAFRMLGHGGTANVLGVMPPGGEIALRGSDFLMERRIQGSMVGSNRFPIDVPRYVDFYLQGRLKLDALISQRITLADVNRGFEDMKAGKVARSMIIFD